MHSLQTIKRLNAASVLRHADAKAHAAAQPAAPKAAYLGHHPDGSGVQLHSAGSLYPFVTYEQETGGAQRALFVAYGEIKVRVGSYETAEQLAATAREIVAPAGAQLRSHGLAVAARILGLSPERA
jgi:hypothetical protein